MNTNYTPNYEDLKKEFGFDDNESQSLNDAQGTGPRPTAFNICLDVSGSMSTYYDTLVESFNELMIPSLYDFHIKTRNQVVVGGALFAKNINPIWSWFKAIEKLDQNSLNRLLVHKEGLGASTALYKTMGSALYRTHNVMEQLKKRNKNSANGVQGKICILTDGANNEEPTDPSIILATLNKLAPPQRFGNRKIDAKIAFFKTSQGLNEADAHKIVKETGFGLVGFFDITKGTNETERKRLFRHSFSLVSKTMGKQ